MPEPPSPRSPGSTRRASAPSVSADDRRQLDGVVALLGDLFGDDLVAVYLHGSAVLDGLHPESDLDLMAFVRRPPRTAEREALLPRLVAASGVRSAERPRRPLELELLLEHAVRPFRYPPRRELQYGEWLRRDLQAGDWAAFQPAEDANLIMALSIARSAGISLFGPRAPELIDWIPREVVARAVLDTLERTTGWLADDTRNVLLTLARMWVTVETGEIRSKDGAADWALERLPEEHRAVLARAREAYLGERPDRWDDVQAQVRAHGAFVAAEIERAAGENLQVPASAAIDLQRGRKSC